MLTSKVDVHLPNRLRARARIHTHTHVRTHTHTHTYTHTQTHTHTHTHTDPLLPPSSQEVLPSLAGEVFGDFGPKAQAYVCGPSSALTPVH